MKRIKRIIKTYFIISGIVFNVFIFWMVAKWPIYFDKLLIKSERPIPGEAIICVAGGATGNNLPTEAGWQRIHTALQLYFDNYAPKIIFTGAGTGKITEAEIYAEAAQWLGCPDEAIVLVPKGNSTAEHPLNILKIEKLAINKNSPLNIVTSSLHSRRASMCFKKTGFTNFRLITSYSIKKPYLAIDSTKKPYPSTETSKKTKEAIDKYLKVSQFKNFRPSDKKYNDLVIRLRTGTSYFFEALREIVAIGWYKIKGYV